MDDQVVTGGKLCVAYENQFNMTSLFEDNLKW